MTTDNEQMPEEDAVHPGYVYPQLRSIAEDYHVPMDTDAIHAWGDNLMARHTKQSDLHKEFTDYVKQMAAGMYPTLANQINNGMSVRHLLEPYRMVAKSVLGQHVEPNFHQPNWNKALTGTVDEKSGRPAPMSMEAWRQELVSNPEFGWHETDNGRQHISRVLDELSGLLRKGAR